MALKTNKPRPKNKTLGFTIVELLVVIVVIGILAAITIVSYIGITKKASESTLQSDLATAKKQFALYYTEHGVYPTDLDGNKCPTGTTDPSPDTNYCLKPSSGDDVEISEADGSRYKLTATKGALVYTITEDTGLTVNDPDWITIGTQKWARKNLNVGVMIDGSIPQTNNGGTNTIEKYCYGNNEAYCTTYGALYQWNEAMNYSITEGAQGICPVGSHVPSGMDWSILDTYLGSATAGAQIKFGGGSGFNMQLAGFYFNGSFYQLSSYGFAWSSSKYGVSAWDIYVTAADAVIVSNSYSQSQGFSIRCLKN